MNQCIILSSLILFALSFAKPLRAEDKHDEHEESHAEESDRFGPRKGVTDVSEALGFRLNTRAFRNFKIVVQVLPGSKPWRIPRKAIAYSKAETHVFLAKDGYFKSADVKILKRESEFVVIESKDLKNGDTIAIQGAGFLTIVNEAVFGAELAHEH